MKGKKETKTEIFPPDRAKPEAVYLRTVRKALELSQKEIGDRLNMGKQNVSHIENGRQGLSIPNLRRLHQMAPKVPLPVGQAKPPTQVPIEWPALLEIFENLPPLLRQSVYDRAAWLRDMMADLPEQVRAALGPPPRDPVSYAEWERGIEELVNRLKQPKGGAK